MCILGQSIFIHHYNWFYYPHAKTFQVTKRVWSIEPSTTSTINKTKSITDTIRSTSAPNDITQRINYIYTIIFPLNSGVFLQK